MTIKPARDGGALRAFANSELHVVGRGKPWITLSRALMAVAVLAGLGGVAVESGKNPQRLLASVFDHTQSATAKVHVSIQGRTAGAAQVREFPSVGRAPAPVAPAVGDCGTRPDIEMADDGSPAYGRAQVPCKAAKSFVRSRMGVVYSRSPELNEHRTPNGETEIIEGGVTDRSSLGLRPVAGLGDPSDAFMNIAAATVARNEGLSLGAAVVEVEKLALEARECALSFGPSRSCSFTVHGVTIDYTGQRFAARLVVKGAPTNVMGGVTGKVVAFESAGGLIEGPGFQEVARAHHEVPILPSEAPAPGR